MKYPIKTQLHKLQLVFHPVSNQEAEWYKKAYDVQEIIKNNSNLYMIVQHKNLKFVFKEYPLDSLVKANLTGTVSNGDLHSSFEIDLVKLTNYFEAEIELALGEKIIKIIKVEDDSIIEWFTPEKLAYYKSRGYQYIIGLEEYRQILTFKLHYIGLSNKNDSFTRLVSNPHSARIEILSNEDPMGYGARVTDEMFLLFFRIPSTEIKVYTWNQTDELLDNLESLTGTKKEIIADAEKAFIHILRPKYNNMKYSSYPESQDGLFTYELNGYMFFIGESLILQTDNEVISGNYTEYEYDPQKIADYIIIKDNQVLFKKSN